jgi:RNA polymerase sigma-70 factor (ECF subfamily)
MKTIIEPSKPRAAVLISLVSSRLQVRECIANVNLAAGEGLSYHQTDCITDQGAPVSSFSSSADPPAPLLEEDDLVLIRRITVKDRQAFETFYYRYAPRLGRYLMRLLRKRELVEEVINDAMLVVWQNAACFDPATARLSSWLFGITHNKALKALARTSRQAKLPRDDSAGGEPDEPIDDPPALDDPERTAMHHDLGRVLAWALETLSPEHRAVVELTFYEDYSYPEIATIIGCPLNTVKTRMFHARRRLAQVLAGLGLGYP